MTRVFKPSLDSRWHLSMYPMDEGYRLTGDAEDNWEGLICDDGADEVLDLTTEASIYGWRYARELAEHLVETHNEFISNRENVPPPADVIAMRVGSLED